MKKKVLLYKSPFCLGDEVSIGIAIATPNNFLKRLFTGKRCRIEHKFLTLKSYLLPNEQLPYIKKQLMDILN